MPLKPQDIVVALKLCGYGAKRPPISQIALQLVMSPSEVHGAVRRAHASWLLHGPEMDYQPNHSALEEFLIHGVRYAFPVKPGELSRGIATGFSAAPLREFMVVVEPLPLVWPYPDGKLRGLALQPLYRTVPAAAVQDSELYAKLALVDALRVGRSRERSLAERELLKRLRRTQNGNSKP